MNAEEAARKSKKARELMESNRLLQVVPKGIIDLENRITDAVAEGMESSILSSVSRHPEVREHFQALGYYISEDDWIYWGEAKANKEPIFSMRKPAKLWGIV